MGDCDGGFVWKWLQGGAREAVGAAKYCYCNCCSLFVCLRLSAGAGLTRLFSCENAKVANNFAEISSESTFQLSSNRLTLSIDEANIMHQSTTNDPHIPSFMYLGQGCGSVYAFQIH